ncbi:Retrovirus-related Pol polyprotein from transposon 17.6, partial [Mucuna pruriens]
MEKELLAIVFALDKFQAYLLFSKIIVFSNHAVLKYLLKKQGAKPRLIWGMLLLQEFNLEIRDRKGGDNIVADHLSHIKGKVDPIPIRDDFINEQLLLVAHNQPWFADICNFLIASIFSLGVSKYYKEKIQSDAKHYVWDDPYLWRCCNDRVICRCILNSEIRSVPHFCHSTPGGGHYGSIQTAKKFGVPKALISDQGTHFCNKAMSSLLEKYGVVHRIVTPYHLQINGQAEELEELHLEAYENLRIYKQKILRKEFKVSQKVLLFHSHLKLIVGCSRGLGPSKPDSQPTDSEP